MVARNHLTLSKLQETAMILGVMEVNEVTLVAVTTLNQCRKAIGKPTVNGSNIQNIHSTKGPLLHKKQSTSSYIGKLHLATWPRGVCAGGQTLLENYASIVGVVVVEVDWKSLARVKKTNSTIIKEMKRLDTDSNWRRKKSALGKFKKQRTWIAQDWKEQNSIGVT